jgi:hypothetical protein
MWRGLGLPDSSDTPVFPFHKVGIGGNSRTVEVYDLHSERPMGPCARRGGDRAQNWAQAASDGKTQEANSL